MAKFIWPLFYTLGWLGQHFHESLFNFLHPASAGSKNQQTEGTSDDTSVHHSSVLVRCCIENTASGKHHVILCVCCCLFLLLTLHSAGELGIAMCYRVDEAVARGEARIPHQRCGMISVFPRTGQVFPPGIRGSNICSL